jgi:CRP/FNR family transcriptional regulator
MNSHGVDKNSGPALAFLDAEERSVLQSVCVALEVPAGGILFRAGETAAMVYFLVSGRMVVRKRTGFADKMQVVALLDPGAPIGEGAAIPGQLRGAAVIAIDVCRLLSLERRQLEILQQKNPGLAVKIMMRLLQVTHLRLQKSSERLVHIM